MTLHIGLDIDDTLYDFQNLLYPHLNEFTGQDIKYHEIHSFHLPLLWNLTVKDIHQIIKDKNLYKGGVIHPLTVRKIQELYLQGHIVSFVTSRILYDDYKTEELTREFLLSHGLKDTLHFSENKGKTCNDEKIDLFVDDGLHNLKSILSISPETTCYTVDKPWNREKEIERVGLTTEEVTKIIRLRSLSLLKV